MLKYAYGLHKFGIHNIQIRQDLVYIIGFQ